MSLTSIRLGAGDLEKARIFYDATFAALGIAPSFTPAGAQLLIYRMANGPFFMIGPPRNGDPATAANGGTILFAAPSEEAVARWHSAGLVHGGTDEGAPGPRAKADNAIGAYLLDPDGNKLGAFYDLTIA